MGRQSVNEITRAQPPRTWDRLTDPFASRRVQQHGRAKSVAALDFAVPHDRLVHQNARHDQKTESQDHGREEGSEAEA